MSLFNWHDSSLLKLIHFKKEERWDYHRSSLEQTTKITFKNFAFHQKTNQSNTTIPKIKIEL